MYGVSIIATSKNLTEGVINLPILSRFYGMVVKMYFSQAEHNPPHVHFVYDNEFMGALDINTGAMIEGDLPSWALKMAKEWISINRDELLKMWTSQEFKQLPPLK